ncbi:hypothetical protein OAK91_06535 [Planctomycetaceae bacterium]|jgi:hypothetical protein|nr:hypothetical protein [Planctomycetaceae bacterium]
MFNNFGGLVLCVFLFANVTGCDSSSGTDTNAGGTDVSKPSTDGEDQDTTPQGTSPTDDVEDVGGDVSDL